MYGYSRKHKIKQAPTLYDYAAALLALSSGVYFSAQAERISVRIPILDPLSTLDLFFGVIFVVLTIEAARRTMGFPIIAIVFIGLGYSIWGHHFSGLWHHREFSISEIINDVAYSYNGIWGSHSQLLQHLCLCSFYLVHF